MVCSNPQSIVYYVPFSSGVDSHCESSATVTVLVRRTMFPSVTDYTLPRGIYGWGAHIRTYGGMGSSEHRD